MGDANVRGASGSARAGFRDLQRECGDLWTLAWDGEVLGSVMVSAVETDYILGWPVTLPGDASFRPGILLDSPSGHKTTAWPTRETGIGNHLLDERLGSLLTPQAVREVSSALDADEEAAVQWVESWGTDEQEETMADRWANICFHTGRPDTAEKFLDEAKVRAAGGNAKMLASLLSLETEDVRSILLGEEPVAPEEAQLIAQNLNVAMGDLLGPDPALDLWLMLAEPSFKAGVVNASRIAGIPEIDVRVRASRDAYALAARDDSASRNRQKLQDALGRIVLGGRP